MDSLHAFAVQFAAEAQRDISPTLFEVNPQRLTYLDYAHHMLSMKSITTMGDKQFESHAKVIGMLLGMAGANLKDLPCTLNRFKALLGVSNMWESVRHFCPKWHRIFPDTPQREWSAEEECGCEYTEGDVVMTCKEKRFNTRELAHGPSLVPREWMVYLGIERTMRRWMGHIEWWKQRAQKEARDANNADIWGGGHAKWMDGKLGGDLMRDWPFDETEITPSVFVRLWSMIEAGFDHYPVFGKGAKRYAHTKLLDMCERKV